MPCNPGLIPRSPFKAHDFAVQNVFDWVDLHLAMKSGRSTEFMTETDLTTVAPLPPVSASRLSR